MKPRPLSDVKIRPAEILVCRRLYEQLLDDAVKSLRHPLRQDNANTKAQREGRGFGMPLLNTLVGWVIAERDPGPFSFERCCVVLGLEPDAVRDRLRAEGLLEPPEVRVQQSLAARNARRRDIQRAA